jgi:hypothetical protein
MRPMSTDNDEIVTPVTPDELRRDLAKYLDMVKPDAEGRLHPIEIERDSRKAYLVSEQLLGGYRTTIELLQDPAARDALKDLVESR